MITLSIIEVEGSAQLDKNIYDDLTVNIVLDSKRFFLSNTGNEAVMALLAFLITVLLTGL